MCTCIFNIDADLLARGTNAAVLTNMLGHPRALVTLYKRKEKKRGRLPLLQASFCPFCGERYPEATEWGKDLDDLAEQSKAAKALYDETMKDG